MTDNATLTHDAERGECEHATDATGATALPALSLRPSNDLLALDGCAPIEPGARSPERTSTNVHYSVACDGLAFSCTLDALDSNLLWIIITNVGFPFLMKSVCKCFLAVVGAGTTTKTANVLALGSPSVFEWARDSGCVFKEEGCARAAGRGDLATLQRARAYGCPWDAWTCALAARGGHLAILQWARAHGCPWDSRVTEYAMNKCHMEIFEWSRRNGCPIIYKRTEGWMDTNGNRRWRIVRVMSVYEEGITRFYRQWPAFCAEFVFWKATEGLALC